MTQTISDLIARWDSPEGHPYKGSLIDMRAYDADPENIGCMCAQGQVLHLIGGMEPRAIHNTAQAEADRLAADLLKISRAHAVLLRSVNDSMDGAPSIVLTDPGKVLGDQWSKLLDFWWHLDQMTPAQWAAAGVAAGVAARDAARAAARDAAGVAAGVAAGDAAGAAARDAARDAAGAAARAAAWASNEIQGAALMIERGQAFHFLPFFGFASSDAIPARPDGYAS
ncbi:MAG: hypothetical protein ACSLE1_03105 [Sphingobium sp.]